MDEVSAPLEALLRKRGRRLLAGPLRPRSKAVTLTGGAGEYAGLHARWAASLA